ncbi:class E sortase [Candidatus Nomurabacteria bacterium]|nr:MAG: class E sortase [Candidatus Nomurabacteria bacterium]
MLSFKLKNNTERLRVWRKVNTCVSYVIYAVAFYLVVYPYVPEATFAVKRVFANTAVYTSDNYAASFIGGPNRLIIPSIDLNQEIIEADSIKEIHENVWHRPNASTPPMGSNTVLIAHRYASIGGLRSSTFYHLPKLVPGSVIKVVWDHQIYTYEITSTEIVDPTRLDIESPTPGSELTLYTCTPLWTSSQRFVVHARLLSS